jgi:lysophospholipase L1-like esterase
VWQFFNSTDASQAGRNFKILALGDSYTIGESVCRTCSFPEQLKERLTAEFSDQDVFELEVLARTGWTTTDLKNAIDEESPLNDFDLVTLLIGVNNQFQNRPFSLYETEFEELVNSAISFGEGNAENVIILSIPDYSYTPFGQNFNTPTIRSEITAYNEFSQEYCESNQLSYIYITDITDQGLDNAFLVASDGLHPSTLAYSQFVDRLMPLALTKLDR